MALDVKNLQPKRASMFPVAPALNQGRSHIRIQSQDDSELDLVSHARLRESLGSKQEAQLEVPVLRIGPLDSPPSLSRPLSVPFVAFERTSTLLEHHLHTSNDPMVYVHVIGARNLRAADSGGSSDPYVSIAVGSKKVYTATVYSSLHPQWNEENILELGRRRCFLSLCVWDEDLVGRDNFLGEVRIPVWEYEPNVMHLKRFQLERGRGQFKDVKVSGDISIRFLYRPVLEETDTDADLAPQVKANYDRLRNLLVDQNCHAMRHLLAGLMRLDDGAAVNAVHGVLVVFQHHTFPSTMKMLEYVLDIEVTKSVEVTGLFRNNSLAPKLLAKYAYSVGSVYMQELLRPLVENVIHSRKKFELDPSRLHPGKDDHDRNVQNVLSKCTKFLDAILASGANGTIPIQLRWVAKLIRERVEPRFPDGVLNSLASFFFLRFICPAIVAPHHFKVTEQPVKLNMRFLMFIAKILQTLANKAGSDDSAGGASDQILVAKEPHMKKALPWIEENLPRVRKFLLSLTDVSNSSVLPGFEDLDPAQVNPALVEIHRWCYRNMKELFAVSGGHEVRNSGKSTDLTHNPTISEEVERASVASTTTLVSNATTESKDVARGSVNILASASKDSAQTMKSVTDETDADADEDTDDQKADSNACRAYGAVVEEFRQIIVALGPPPMNQNNDRVKTAPVQAQEQRPRTPGVVGRLGSLIAPAQNDSERDRPGFLKKLRNRMLSGMVPSSNNSVSVTSSGRSRAPTVSEEGLMREMATLQKKFIVMLEDSQKRMEERDAALSSVHRDHQRVVEDLAYLTAYVAQLENELRANDIPLPQKPKRAVISPGSPQSPSVASGSEMELLSLPDSSAASSRSNTVSSTMSDRSRMEEAILLTESVERKVSSSSRKKKEPKRRPQALKLGAPIVAVLPDDALQCATRPRSNSVMINLRRGKDTSSKQLRGRLAQQMRELKYANNALRNKVQLQELHLMQYRHQNMGRRLGIGDADDEDSSTEEEEEDEPSPRAYSYVITNSPGGGNSPSVSREFK